MAGLNIQWFDTFCNKSSNSVDETSGRSVVAYWDISLHKSVTAAGICIDVMV